MVRQTSNKDTKTTSDWEYEEFCDWAVKSVADGLFTSGLKGLKTAVVYSVIQQCCSLMEQGGFRE